MSDVTIVVDAQNGFTKMGNLASPECRDTIPAVVEAVRVADERGDHLVFTTDWHRIDDLEFAVFPVHCVEGSDEAEIVAELQPYVAGASVIRKRRYSAFYGTELERVLDELAPDVITVCGFCSDICVLHTVADLRNRDHRVRVLAGAVATFDGANHPAAQTTDRALAHMRDILGAEVE